MHGAKLCLYSHSLSASYSRHAFCPCSRVPKSRMFQTFISVVLQKRKSLTSQGSYEDDGRPLNEVIDAIITRRLRKLEGLRAYLRHFLSYGAQTNASTAFYVASTESPSDTLRSPVTRLSTQQNFLIGKITWLNACLSRMNQLSHLHNWTAFPFTQGRTRYSLSSAFTV